MTFAFGQIESNNYAHAKGSGLLVPLSAVEDDDGDYVLRTVDAAPFGYDAALDRLRTRSDGYDAAADRVRTLPRPLARGENVALLPLAYRTADTAWTTVTMPDWARGFSMFLHVFEVGGSLASGQGYGVELRAGWRSGVPGTREQYLRIETARHQDANRNIVVMCHPDAAHPGDAAPFANVETAAVGGLCPPFMAWRHVISGDFSGGDGVRARLDLLWLP